MTMMTTYLPLLGNCEEFIEDEVPRKFIKFSGLFLLLILNFCCAGEFVEVVVEKFR